MSHIKNLIEAFQIFEKYIDPEQFPTHCQHDVMYVCVDEEQVSAEDLARLDELGFVGVGIEGGFMSYRYGSC